MLATNVRLKNVTRNQFKRNFTNKLCGLRSLRTTESVGQNNGSGRD